MLFVMAMGGKIHFWQSFAAVIYASFPVAVIRFVLNALILYLKDPTDIHPIMGQQTLVQDSLNFLVLPSEHPVLYALLGAFSLWRSIGCGSMRRSKSGREIPGRSVECDIGVYAVLVLWRMAGSCPGISS